MADQVQGIPAPLPPPPPDPAQAGQQAQQQQQQQDHIDPPAHAPTAQQQGQQIVHLNWSHFKPEFLGKSYEDAEAHLLHTNDWMTCYIKFFQYRYE